MALFPQSFLDDLKGQIDIVSVVGDVVSLRKIGRDMEGTLPLSPGEDAVVPREPGQGRFQVLRLRRRRRCRSRSSSCSRRSRFPEAVRSLAQRVGLPVPESPGGPEDRAAAAEREALVALHEQAAAFYVEQLAAPGGARARQRARRPRALARDARTVRLRLRPGRGAGDAPDALRRAQDSRRAATQERPGRGPGRPAGRSVPPAADDPDSARNPVQWWDLEGGRSTRARSRNT